jgi:hypothetical protein
MTVGLQQTSEGKSCAPGTGAPIQAVHRESGRAAAPATGLKAAERLYLLGAGLVLIFSAAVKIISASERARILEDADSIVFFLSNRQLMLVAAALEACVAFAVLRPCGEFLSVRTKFGLVALLSSLFAVYRAGRLFANDPRPCKCLGNWLIRIGMSERQVQTLALAILAFLLVPSIAWLLTRGCRASPAYLSSVSPMKK